MFYLKLLHTGLQFSRTSDFDFSKTILILRTAICWCTHQLGIVDNLLPQTILGLVASTHMRSCYLDSFEILLP